MKIKTTGTIEPKIAKIILKLENAGEITQTSATEANFLVVGVDSENDIFAEVIFRKDELAPKIYADRQFDEYLRDEFPEYYL